MLPFSNFYRFCWRYEFTVSDKVSYRACEVKLSASITVSISIRFSVSVRLMLG